MQAILLGMRLFLTVLVLLSLIAHREAHALEVTALGGATYAAPTERNANGTMTWTGNSAFSYGITASYPIFDLPFELETGLFSIANEIEGAVNGVDTTRKSRALHVPFLLRFNFDPWISLAAGGYYSSGQGNVDTSASGTTVSQSYAAAGLLPDDAGLLIGLKAKLHVTTFMNFVLDARYQHGLKNVASSSAYLYNTRSVQVFAGLGFDFTSTPTASKGQSNPSSPKGPSDRDL
jgi:hypothetical protein